MLRSQGDRVHMGLCSLLSPSPPVHELVPLTGVLEEDCQMVHKSFTSSHDCDLMLKQFHFQWVLILRIKQRRKSPFGTSAVWKIFLPTLLGLWGCVGLGKGACQQGGTQETNHSTTKQTKTQKKKQSYYFVTLGQQNTVRSWELEMGTSAAREG